MVSRYSSVDMHKLIIFKNSDIITVYLKMSQNGFAKSLFPDSVIFFLIVGMRYKYDVK